MTSEDQPKPDEKFLLKNGRVLLKEMFDGLAYSYPAFDVYPESRIVGLTSVSIIMFNNIVSLNGLLYLVIALEYRNYFK